MPEGLELPKLTPGTLAEYLTAVTVAIAANRVTVARGRALLYAAQVMQSGTPKADTSTPAAEVLRRQNRTGGQH